MGMRNYIPFSYKMMLPYLLLVMITDVVIGFFSYQTALQSRTELVQTNVKWTMQQISDNIQYKMLDMQAVSDSLFGSTSFQKYLQITGDSLEVYEMTSRNLLPTLETSLGMSVQKIRLILYPANKQINEVYGKLDTAITSQSYHILSFSRLEQQADFRKFVQSGKDNKWIQMDTDKSLNHISLLRKLISFNDYQTEIGYLRMSIPLKDIFLSFAALDLNEGSVIRIINQSDGATLIQNAEASGSADDYLKVKIDIPASDFRLETMVPMKILKEDAGKIRNITMLVCGISFVIIALIAVIIARYSGRKMLRIVTHVRSFQNGNFDMRIPFKGNDEFSLLSAAFNRMAHHIDELIREVYLQGMQKKEKELEALQAQINPHFLYNTLSSINSLANIGEIEKLSAMVSQMSKFYRLTLNDGKMIISLDNEINQVKAYLEIQMIKYANRFSVSYSIEPELADCPIIKLILQPFVENVFQHAWFEEHIHIGITGRREDDNIILQINDNGIGMPAEKLQVLLQPREEPGGYGIRNVNERIKLQYGEEYGVFIDSKIGIGTSVRLTLPYLKSQLHEGGASNELPYPAGG